jgi:hypothetical protein
MEPRHADRFWAKSTVVVFIDPDFSALTHVKTGGHPPGSFFKKRNGE